MIPRLHSSREYGTTLPYPASLGAYLHENGIKEGCLTDFWVDSSLEGEMSIRQLVRRSTKILSDFSEIWYVHRGR